ncbi:hypothetical protein C8F04DRAFT_478802 [Mycena alexandri]|uniref:Uncharacterized protein n=1 Tax=Mycena alexandri TaxID=1745969 RepID=A0AAD6X4K7_9AGAR|nr:hypothetical protein C8F04DRAFT_478802 [Mycena alexandri]
MATELKERERDGKERERRRERDNDDSRSHRSHRPHREREDHDHDDGSHRSHRDSHRSRDDAERDRRRHHSHSPPRERRHSTSSRAHEHEPSRRSHSRESKRHSSSGDHKDDVKAPAYPPDFLRQYSPAGSIGGNDKFDVITGAEAVRFTKQFIRDQAAEGTTLPPALAAALPSTTPPSAPLPLIAKSPSATSHKSLTAHNALESRGSKRLHPVVFALPRSATNAAGGAGRKVVDFYMSWRGKTKTHPLKGPSRRANFLDTEFRRVRETLDGEWKRASRAIKGGFGGSTTSDAPLPVLSAFPSASTLSLFLSAGFFRRVFRTECLASILRGEPAGWMARAGGGDGGTRVGSFVRLAAINEVIAASD